MMDISQASAFLVQWLGFHPSIVLFISIGGGPCSIHGGCKNLQSPQLTFFVFHCCLLLFIHFLSRFATFLPVCLWKRWVQLIRYVFGMVNEDVLWLELLHKDRVVQA